LGQMKAARVKVETFELAQHEPEVVSAREHQIVETFLSRVQRACRDFMKGGLPQMEDRPVYEEHSARPFVRAQPASEKGGELQAARAPAHDHDLVLHPETIPASGRGC